ncbi:hypothetical protein ZIOFF_044383 [Zingiber officinale]|uniref:Growth-regulating factor n=2 Tax=Zingiber officinale TaxID=94328 RepID=A0A8J5FZ00_ZINOF|nr:hypothetical protein ZIOFF_044383 [Zingiber officinale]
MVEGRFRDSLGACLSKAATSVSSLQSEIGLLSEKEETDLSQASSEETDRPLLHASSGQAQEKSFLNPLHRSVPKSRSHIKGRPSKSELPPHSLCVSISMDAYLWGNRQQSEHQPCAGHTKLQHLDQQQSHASALALLAPEPNSSLNKDVGYFTLAQWQELELQALIYKYMLAGASVPMELILPIKRSLLGASPYFHYPEFYHHLQPSLSALQTGYWGKCTMDPEPGRCRRTDGKKWRCSREVVVGQKYCERHVHRGRNRSRKHVEAPTPYYSKSSSKSGLCSPSPLLAQENHFDLPRSLATLNTQSLDQRTTVEKNLQSNCLNFYLKNLQDDKAEGYVLQSFLDEWPKSQRENTDSIDYTVHPASTTHLSISAPGNQLSDFSLKLSTGNPERSGQDNKNGCETQLLVSYGQASMGGPLAEALRSSASTHSPTSVLHNSNGSISEISSISP